jgi:hypothetical protein
MKLTLNAFESETNNLKIEIQMKHNDNKRLRERLDAIERDYQHVSYLLMKKKFFFRLV